MAQQAQASGERASDREALLRAVLLESSAGCRYDESTTREWRNWQTRGTWESMPALL